MSISDYGKVYAAGHRNIERLFDGPVIVQEKVDGSQFSMSVDGVRSRNRDMTEHAEEMFNKAVGTVEKLRDQLHPGWIYRCEFLSKPKHNTLCYERVPSEYLVVFDIETGPGYFLPPAEMQAEAARLGLETVPCYYEGVVGEGGVTNLLPYLDKSSFLGGPIEGIVIKNYAHYTDGGHILKGKLVSEDFKEKHVKDWKERNPSRTDIVQLITESYRTPARWEKSIQHLQERGELSGEPKDIGPLMKEIAADFTEECRDEVAAQLFDVFVKGIVRGLGWGFPEYYKRRIAGLTNEEDR